MSNNSKKRSEPALHPTRPPAQPVATPSKARIGRSAHERAQRSRPVASETVDGGRYRNRTRLVNVKPVLPSPASEEAERSSPAVAQNRVGYCNPPKETQFKKGKSGNPKGRPRGSKNFSTILNEIMSRSLNVVVNGKPQRMSTTEALLEKILRVALEKGDLPKAVYLLSRVQENEARVAAIAAQRVTATADPELSEADLAILADHRRELLLAHLGDGADVDGLMQMLGLAQDAGPLSDAAGHPGPSTDEGARP